MIKSIIKNLLLKRGKLLNNIFYKKRMFHDFFDMLQPVHGGYDLIRVGSKYDGGYLLPNDLKNIKYCFSPGVSDNSTFEEDLYENFNIKSYMCDNSIDTPSIFSEGFHFIKKHLSTKSNDHNITLDEWISNNLSDQEMVLQMDIEGSEYDIILNSKPEILDKFRIIVIEFHSFEQIFTYGGFKLLKNTFKKLLANHSVIHIHPNNIVRPFIYKEYEIPTGLEITLLRNDRIKDFTLRKLFPHELDSPTNKDNFNFALPKCFYEKIT